jgi:fatty acid desaturase
MPFLPSITDEKGTRAMAAVQIEWYRIPAFHQMVGMSAAVHELNHGAVSKTKRINELFPCTGIA